eukprot:scaffold1950_cov366-Prasinococcus_capsulatus_cf.AAC.7
MCGGCAAAVKRALEAQDEVEVARVNFATENAVVAVKKDAGTTADKLKALAEKLAGVVTAAGFPAKARGALVLTRRIDENVEGHNCGSVDAKSAMREPAEVEPMETCARVREEERDLVSLGFARRVARKASGRLGG